MCCCAITIVWTVLAGGQTTLTLIDQSQNILFTKLNLSHVGTFNT
jgi:ACR3 family arsenite efflux pump ArsB